MDIPSHMPGTSPAEPGMPAHPGSRPHEWVRGHAYTRIFTGLRHARRRSIHGLGLQAPSPRATRTGKPPRPGKRWSPWRIALLVALLGFVAAIAAAYVVVARVARTLPDDLSAALDYQPNRASRVYAADGALIGEFYLQKRVLVSPAQIPEHVRDAFVAAEDGRFWAHPGFDFAGILRAAYANYRSGETRQGASTITQQVMRMLMLDNERTYERKLKEVILSVRVERELSKAQILHLYLNHIYLGQGAYGVEAGAEVYFGKQVSDLTVAEAALLAGLVQAPSRYAPGHDIDAARQRQRYVLDRMRADGYLTAAERTRALAEPLALIGGDRPLNHVAAPYFVEHVRRWATRRFEPDVLLHGGLRIHTTLDSRMQQAAEAAVRAGLISLDRRIGFRGPIGHVDDLTAPARRARATMAGHAPRPYTGSLADLAHGEDHTLLPDVVYVGVVAALPGGRPGNLAGEMAGADAVIVALGPVSLPMERGDARQVRRWRREPGSLPSEGRSDGQPQGRSGGRSGGRPEGRSDDRSRGQRGIRVGDLVPVSVIFGAQGPREVQLAQAPDVQAALIALEPDTGRVVAQVGGYDYAQSQFDRALQAHRQIGSAIKPFIYALALQSGMTHLTPTTDRPVTVHTAAGAWSPGNYDDRYYGRVTLRTALAKSLNSVSVRLLSRLGIDSLVELLRAAGIRAHIPRHISIALGTPDLTLLEAAAAYGVFASGGRRVQPRFIDWVEDGEGRIVEDRRDQRPGEQVISPQLAYLTTDLLTAVVRRGTGRAALALGRPAAGKTGTSTEHRDAWFLGFTADLVCGVWVGRDDFTPIGAKATGSSAALPIWVDFMAAAHADTPTRDFPPPADIWFVRTHALTGRLAPPGSYHAEWVPMLRGSMPGHLGAHPASFGRVRHSPFRPRP